MYVYVCNRIPKCDQHYHVFFSIFDQIKYLFEKFTLKIENYEVVV